MGCSKSLSVLKTWKILFDKCNRIPNEHSLQNSSFPFPQFFFFCKKNNTNYGVIKGFPAPKNSLTKRVKKYHILYHVYLLSPISGWHVTRLAHHSVRLDEWTAKPSPLSIQGSLWEFSGIMEANTEKSKTKIVFHGFLWCRLSINWYKTSSSLEKSEPHRTSLRKREFIYMCNSLS